MSSDSRVHQDEHFFSTLTPPFTRGLVLEKIDLSHTRCALQEQLIVPRVLRFQGNGAARQLNESPNSRFVSSGSVTRHVITQRAGHVTRPL